MVNAPRTQRVYPNHISETDRSNYMLIALQDAGHIRRQLMVNNVVNPSPEEVKEAVSQSCLIEPEWSVPAEQIPDPLLQTGRSDRRPISSMMAGICVLIQDLFTTNYYLTETSLPGEGFWKNNSNVRSEIVELCDQVRDAEMELRDCIINLNSHLPPTANELANNR